MIEWCSSYEGGNKEKTGLRSLESLGRYFSLSTVVDPVKYTKLQESYCENKNFTLQSVLEGLQARVPPEYYQKTYRSQHLALSISERVFPVYRFLLPDVLADDWAAIVGLHKKHKRDHALHQPLTSGIVIDLLTDESLMDGVEGVNISNKKTTLAEKCVEIFLSSSNEKASYFREFARSIGVDDKYFDLSDGNNRFFWKELFIETATISALFHDIGYPWEYINTVCKNLNLYEGNQGRLPYDVEHIEEVFGDRLILYPFRGYRCRKAGEPAGWRQIQKKLMGDAFQKTHGFPGALAFLFLNDKISDFPNNQDSPAIVLCREWVALGIMMHDMKGIYWGDGEKKRIPDNKFLQLEVDRDPLGCVVALADVIQEFSRPAVEFPIDEQKKSGEVVCKYKSPCWKTKVDIKNAILTVQYFYEKQEDADRSRYFKCIDEGGDEKSYFTPDVGYLDLSAIGIKRVKIECMVEERKQPKRGCQGARVQP